MREFAVEAEREKAELTASRENNLAYMVAENDELEMKTIRLKQGMVRELEHIEEKHNAAIDALVRGYEKSLNAMKDEIRRAVNKLKDNGDYFEKVIEDQELEYEAEIVTNEYACVDNA